MTQAGPKICASCYNEIGINEVFRTSYDAVGNLLCWCMFCHTGIDQRFQEYLIRRYGPNFRIIQ